MKYAIDRIEENIVILEKLNTREIIELDKKLLPSNIKDGSIIKFENNKYSLDEEETKHRLEIIKNKMDRLKKLKN